MDEWKGQQRYDHIFFWSYVNSVTKTFLRVTMCQALHTVSHFIFTRNCMEVRILLCPFYRWENETFLRVTMCQAQNIVSHFIFTMNPMEAGILLSPFYRWGNESPEKLRNLHKVTWLLTRKSEIYPILSNDTLPLNKHPFTPHAKLSAVLRTQQWAKEKLFLTSGNPKISRNLWASTSNPQLNKKKNQNPEFREGK